MTCAWCKEPLQRSRRDAKTCSQRCRQALWRFGLAAVARARAATPLRLAYADPPYPGLARRYYEGHPDYAGEVDHRELLSRLQEYDGWALSTSAEALPSVLAVAQDLKQQVRVAAWFRGSRGGVSSAWPVSSWEPVVFAGGRRLVSRDAGEDALIHHARPRTTDPARVIGAKPARFCYWLFQLLGALPGDVFADLYPGSGGVLRAWELYASRAAEPDASAGCLPDASRVDACDASSSPGCDAIRDEQLGATLASPPSQ